ncbi:hypothetical protein ACH5RR_013650 [Cinchona calisaya]|uniref:Josephin-like protein n=1 Tax=Cinchona calisaya TaxID=153742 RepID=A0ABD3A225_9GENT
MTGHFCMPRFRGSRWTRKSNRLSPMSLLDRIREAVFRLMMLSALTKANSSSTIERKSPANEAQRSGNYDISSHDEPHHSEAVADCIEFIKKSATNSIDGSRSSTPSCYSIDDSTDQVIRPLP